MITDTKLYVSVVTLFINGNIKFLETRKQGFKIRKSNAIYRITFFIEEPDDVNNLTKRLADILNFEFYCPCYILRF